MLHTQVHTSDLAQSSTTEDCLHNVRFSCLSFCQPGLTFRRIRALLPALAVFLRCAPVEFSF